MDLSSCWPQTRTSRFGKSLPTRTRRRRLRGCPSSYPIGAAKGALKLGDSRFPARRSPDARRLSCGASKPAPRYVSPVHPKDYWTHTRVDKEIGRTRSDLCVYQTWPPVNPSGRADTQVFVRPTTISHVSLATKLPSLSLSLSLLVNAYRINQLRDLCSASSSSGNIEWTKQQQSVAFYSLQQPCCALTPKGDWRFQNGLRCIEIEIWLNVSEN